LRGLRRPDALLGAIAALVVGAPWYVAMIALHGRAFVDTFLLQYNVVRFVRPEHASQTGHWYSVFLNVPVLLGGFFPWSAFLPQALRRAGGANPGGRLALVWFAVVFVFFSVSKTQLPTYI